MRNFDCFIGIDWSGAKSPVHTKSISVACSVAKENAVELIKPTSHRHWSRSDIANLIQSLTHKSERILIGIDANLGYARTVLAQQFGVNTDYKDLWRSVDTLSSVYPNFFAEGFWQNWPEFFWTEGKRPDHITLPKRIVEQVCGEAGLGWPESPFKLIGPKQVGKGGLAAMRMMYFLKQKMKDQICVWPFERDIADKAQIVITEIYPRQFLKRSAHGNSKVTTLNDLGIALDYFGSRPMKDIDSVTDHDTDAIVSAAGLRWLCGVEQFIPQNISNPLSMDEEAALCEGWIFGV